MVQERRGCDRQPFIQTTPPGKYNANIKRINDKSQLYIEFSIDFNVNLS